jgi:hypothetical protein
VLRSNQPNLFVTKIKANVGEIEIHRQFLSTQRASGDNHHIANNLYPLLTVQLKKAYPCPLSTSPA